MRVASIASGSSGNCIYVGSDRTHLLIDAGSSGKRIEQGIEELGLKAQELDGILLTHEHSDHIAGLGVMARKYSLPIYATQGTVQALSTIKSIGTVDWGLFTKIDADSDFMIGDLTVTPVPVSHDAAQPVAYLFHQGEKSAGVITDLGTYEESLVSRLREINLLLMEANHDVHMLEVGRYPYELKQRILGERGHLSNEACGHLLGEVLNSRTQDVMLGHLSKENNYEELAYETVRLEISMGDCPYLGNEVPIGIAKRDRPSRVMEV